MSLEASEGLAYLLRLGKSCGLAVLIALCLYTFYWTICAIYSLYFHPLSRFPGPKLWAVSRIPYALALRRGRWIFKVKEFHEIYGPVVRVASNELTFIDGAAYKDIYQYYRGQRELPKEDVYLTKMVNGVESILHADDPTHARIKRLLSHAFSERALRGQESFVKQHVDMLVKQLKDRIADGQDVVNVVQWMTWITADVISDLAFGSPFDCTKNAKEHRWAANVFSQFRGASILASTRYFPGMESFLKFCLPKSVMALRWELFREAQDRVTQRLENESDRLDFVYYVKRHNDEKGMTRDEIDATLATLVIAGAETTNTFLTGVILYLLQYPDVLDRLVTEIRSTFAAEEDMSDIKVDKLPYLGAVIKEGMRLSSPSAHGHPRKAQKGGAVVAGEFVPEGTVVSVPHYAALRSARNWKDPDRFIPERWISHNGFDDLDAYEPFSIGPRGCIGRNLANLEARLILARFLWNFDVTMPPNQSDASWKWDSQNAFMAWQKRPLWVKLAIAKH